LPWESLLEKNLDIEEMQHEIDTLRKEAEESLEKNEEQARQICDLILNNKKLQDQIKVLEMAQQWSTMEKLLVRYPGILRYPGFHLRYLFPFLSFQLLQ
jgi:hypothetical protein